jgi:predicted dehydrogenase
MKGYIMRQLRVAIIGQGRSGWKIHGVNFIQQRDMYKVAAVVDPMQKRRDNARELYGEDIDTYSDHSGLFGRKDIDIVVNAAPSHLHFEITKELLENGFDVLCDKPLVAKSKEADILIKTAEDNNRLFTIFQQSRYAAYFRKIKSIVDSGVLGRIIQIGISFSGYARRWDWQTLQAYNGGNLLNTGPHPLDQALVLFGEGMPDIKCFMDRVNTYGDAEDYVKLILSGKGKPVIDIEISSCQAYNPYTYCIQGSRGGLKATMERVDYKYFIPEENDMRKLMTQPLEDEKGEPAYCFETLKWHENTWEHEPEEYGTFAGMTRDFYVMLYEHIVNNGPLEVTPMQVRRQIAVIEECHRQNPMERMEISI